jgi:hypothetical protein
MSLTIGFFVVILQPSCIVYCFFFYPTLQSAIIIRSFSPPIIPPPFPYTATPDLEGQHNDNVAPAALLHTVQR